MSDEVYKPKRNVNMICFDQTYVGSFGEEAMMKYNNAVVRMQEEVCATPGVRVSHIASNEKAALYAVAWRMPGCNGKSDAVYYRYREKEWTMVTSRYRFSRELVRSYLGSVYGMQTVSETDVVRELVLFGLLHEYSTSRYDKYIVHCVAGGLVLARIGTDSYANFLDFFPYEELDQEKVKGFYGDVLRYYASGEYRTGGRNMGMLKDRVPKELVMELAGLRPVIGGNGEITDYKRIKD